MSARSVVAIVGATATGKTALGEAVAREIEGEVVCADSRQVFRELEIGTGKPDRAQRAAPPHHLFEALALEEKPSAGWYARAAREACAAIHAKGGVPVLVGGSGLYLHAARVGLSAAPPEAPEVRLRLRAEAAAAGAAELHRRLAAVDPESAARLDPNDAQRITRALEVWESSGQPLSWWHAQPSAPAVEGTWQVVELTLEPRELVNRISVRTRGMFEGGLVEETRALLARGRGPALRALHAIGYDEAWDLIEARLDRAAAEARTDLRTAQLAKRQRTWFRHQISAVRVAADGLEPARLLERTLAALRARPG
jgi:tRNA dimethylallyltransferase